MNLKFWERTEDDDEEEQDQTPAPVSAVARPSAAERRAARLAAEARKPAQNTASLVEMPPDPGEQFYAGFIGFIHVVAPFLISLLIGVSTGYFLSNFHLTADLPTAVGMGGGLLVAGVDLAIVMQKKRASKYGDDEKAAWLMVVALAFGVVSILTQYIYLQVNLTAASAAKTTLEDIPVLGLLIGIGGGSFFVLIRAGVYHLALYASAWGLGDIAPSPEKMVRWQMQQHIRLQTENILREVRARGSVTVSEEQPTGTRDVKDLLAMMQRMQHELTELRVKPAETITANWRTVTPPKEVPKVAPLVMPTSIKLEESEGSGNGRTTFRP